MKSVYFFFDREYIYSVTILTIHFLTLYNFQTTWSIVFKFSAVIHDLFTVDVPWFVLFHVDLFGLHECLSHFVFESIVFNTAMICFKKTSTHPESTIISTIRQSLKLSFGFCNNATIDQRSKKSANWNAAWGSFGLRRYWTL